MVAAMVAEIVSEGPNGELGSMLQEALHGDYDEELPLQLAALAEAYKTDLPLETFKARSANLTAAIVKVDVEQTQSFAQWAVDMASLHPSPRDDSRPRLENGLTCTRGGALMPVSPFSVATAT